MKKIIYPILLLSLFFVFSCGGKKTIKEEIPCSVLFGQAKEKYDLKKYEKAKDMFHKILYQCTGSSETIKIMYYLGLSYFSVAK